jgi:acetylserotonin N-methyltransferase
MKPDPAPILDLIEAFRRSKTMFTAVAFGVFDGARDACPPEQMEKLLDACVSLGLLEKHGAEYRNTVAADTYLRRDSPDTLAGYILYSNQALYPMWGQLEGALREGTNRWQATFGFDAASLFDHFFRSPESKRDFLMGMHGFGQISSPAIVDTFDLSRFNRLVDLGGATGHLALAAVTRYPGIKAAVFDLPPVVEFARDFVGDHVELIAGNFFTDELPPADLYTLGRILHDWSEPKIRALLAKIRRALPPNGALLIAEKLMREDKSGPVPAHMQSLNMLVCAEGRERTLSEYAALLHDAGFTNIEGRVTGKPLDAILAS